MSESPYVRLRKIYDDRSVSSFSNRALLAYIEIRKRMGDPVDADYICVSTGLSRSAFYRRMAKIGNGNGKGHAMNDEMKPVDALRTVEQGAIAKGDEARREVNLRKESRRLQAHERRQDKKEEERKPILPILNAYREGWKEIPDVEPIQWSPREWNQAKMLVTNIGPDRARLLVEYVFKNWRRTLSAKWKVGGVPTMGIILGFGVSLITELIPKQEKPGVSPELKAKWEADARRRMGLTEKKS